jgi:5-methylcytosine-specific restriction endonuclease McrA
VGAARIDHIVPLKTAPHRALDPSNLRTLCAACDNRSVTTHPKMGQDKVVLGNDARGLPRDLNHPWLKPKDGHRPPG